MTTLHDALLAHFSDPEGIKNVAFHGCIGGVNGFIYYSETSAFFDEHEDEIYDYLNDCELSMVDFAHTGSTIKTLKNDLVWAVVELWCQAQHLANELIAEANS